MSAERRGAWRGTTGSAARVGHDGDVGRVAHVGLAGRVGRAGCSPIGCCGQANAVEVAGAVGHGGGFPIGGGSARKGLPRSSGGVLVVIVGTEDGKPV